MKMPSPQPTVLKNPQNGTSLESGETGIPNDTPADVGATSKEHESQQSYLQGLRLYLIITAYVLIHIGLSLACNRALIGSKTEFVCACSSRIWKFQLSPLL